VHTNKSEIVVQNNAGNRMTQDSFKYLLRSARLAVATKASSVARSPKLSTSSSVSTWMGDHQERLDAVNLDPFVGVDLNL